MTDSELKALITLAADTDPEVAQHAKNKLKEAGKNDLVHLESFWETTNALDEQSALEYIINEIQYDELFSRFLFWLKHPQDLLEGLILVAKIAYPNLSEKDVRQQIEQVYYSCWVDFQSNLQGIDQVRVLNGSFFHKEGFKGNKKAFYAPENNFINDLLSTKKGNPISLATLYLLIGRKLGMPLYGVNLPNLFVLFFKDSHQEFYINIYNNGAVFERQDIDQYISQLKMEPDPSYYSPCTYGDIILRMLRNLSYSYSKLENSEREAEIKSLLAYLNEAGF